MHHEQKNKKRLNSKGYHGVMQWQEKSCLVQKEKGNKSTMTTKGQGRV
jgi:hypothetical protein